MRGKGPLNINNLNLIDPNVPPNTSCAELQGLNATFELRRMDLKNGKLQVNIRPPSTR
jgi:hypothetical protein